MHRPPLIWLGTHKTHWPFLPGWPVMLSVHQLQTRRGVGELRRDLFVDSGAFTHLDRHGRWIIPPSDYAGEVARWAGPRLKHCASQDWLCTPATLAATGLTVAEHQARTTDNFLELATLAPALPWLPTLQGWTADEYVAHAELYRASGVDLEALPLVGLGSIAARQNSGAVEQIVAALAGIRLHGFGVKATGLARYGDRLASLDTTVWSAEARYAGTRLCSSGSHATCQNCLEWAELWAARTAGTDRHVQQFLHLNA